jgi:ATP-dependent helicase/nuclease subunit B
MVRLVDTVIWWDFSDPSNSTNQIFNSQEIVHLKQNRIHVPTTKEKAEKQRDCQQRPIFCANQKLVLFKPLQRAGKHLGDHSIYTRLLAATAKSSIQPCPIDIDAWLTDASSQRPVQLVSTEQRPLPARTRWLHLSKKLNLRPRSTESYSSLNKWMTSPFDYVCQYVAKLKPGFFRDHRLTIDPRLKGNLIHRLTELMFPLEGTDFDWKSAREKQINDWLENQWKELITTEGASLWLRGNRDEEIQLKELAKQTLKDLITLLQQIKATKVIADHQPTTVTFGDSDTELNGKIDLYVVSDKAKPVVIDLKFGGRDARANEIKDGRALQLAVYGHLITEGKWQVSPKSAYYIISSNHWISNDVDVFKHSLEYNPYAETLDSTWNNFRDIWQWRKRQFQKGEIEVLYEGTEKESYQSAPHDKWIPDFCDEKYSPYVALSGWKENT